MKTMLLTGYDNKMQELGELTAPFMLAYASRHSMDFRCVRTYPTNVPAYWQKMLDVVTGFNEGYDAVIWVDADILITNPMHASPLPYFEEGFHASLDWGVDATDNSCFSMCCFIATQKSRRLFEWVIAHRDDYLYGAFPEQTPMRHLYSSSEENRAIMHIHPRRVFNAVPIEVHPSVVEPWQKTDWLCHLTMLAIPERVKLFHEIRRQQCSS